MFVSYVEIAGKDVMDKYGRLLGSPYDFLVELGCAYPHFTAIILSKGIFRKRFAVVPWNQVRRIEQQINLNVSEETLEFKGEYKGEGCASVRKSILDQQVVDTFNRKVVRVNDLHLLRVDRELRIAHVDVGFRALLRRLGWEKEIDSVVRLFYPRSRYLSREQFISWKFIQPLEVVTKGGMIHLNVPHEDLASIPPADLSEIISELDPMERIALFRSLDFEAQVDVLNEMDVEMQKDLMEELDVHAAIRLLERMDSSGATDLLRVLSKSEIGKILSIMSPARARKLKSLLGYEDDIAGGLMTTDFISLSTEMTVAEAIEKIRTIEEDSKIIYYAYVLDAENHLVGMTSLKRLLKMGPDSASKVGDMMEKRPISVSAEASVKEVALLMDKYDFLAIPVVDEQKIMKGMVTIYDILGRTVTEAWGE